MMKKYLKPQIILEEFDVIDIITSSVLFEGITNLNKSSNKKWGDDILDTDPGEIW